MKMRHKAACHLHIDQQPKSFKVKTLGQSPLILVVKS